MILAATGHRPNKLGGYSAAAFEALRDLARGFLQGGPCAHGISGMALGWDQAWAQALVDLGIPWTAAVPFEGQESRWPAQSQTQYARLLARASRVVVVSAAGYSPKAMQDRNEWMVDNADEVVALWDGSAGGTGNCVRYCKAAGRPVVNLWPLWVLRGTWRAC